MKKWFMAVTGLALVVSLLSGAILAYAENVNLIPNPSVETAASSTPANWRADKWGENTTSHSYEKSGRTGSRSLRVSVTSLTSGDAKWMHDDVTVEPNATYTYSTWYKSDVATEIDVQYKTASGAVSYAFVGIVPASGTWKQHTVKFETPADATKASIMHILAHPGTLDTDDFSLTKTILAPTPPVPTDPNNLIANSSFEESATNNPKNWSTNTWGENTAQFSYESSGRTGSKSAKVTMESWKSGDAKWFADQVKVNPNTTYSYTDHYKSSADTRVVAAFVDTTGAYSYRELDGAPTSKDAWLPYTTKFTTPANVASVSVYHVIDSPGYLTLDDVSLAPEAVAPPVQNAVPNASVEQVNGAMPSGWTSNAWGSNTPSFQYMNEGYTGSRSLKITMSGYSSGDAKWMFSPITNLQPGKQYQFGVWYKTNVTPKAVAMITMQDGSIRYAGMPNAQPSSDINKWQRYTGTFTMPDGAVSASAFLFINQNGWLQTDEYSLAPYAPTPLREAMLTITFDDGHEDNVTTALPLLNKYGLKTTQCYATHFIEGQPQPILDGVLAFRDSGHEICSHTVTHPFMSQLTPQQRDYELQHSQAYLRQLTGASVTSFATPYGDYDAASIEQFKKYYSYHRSVDEGFNSKDSFDPYNIKVQNILSTTSAAEVRGWIERAQRDKTWLVLVYHRVASDPGTYDSYTDVFRQHVETIVSTGVKVKTLDAAANDVKSQL